MSNMINNKIPEIFSTDSIKKNRLFQLIKTNELHNIVSFFEEKEFKTNDIFDDKINGDAFMFIVVSGKISCNIATIPNGLEHEVELHSGDSSGDMNLIDREYYNLKCTATEDSKILILTYSNFKRI